MVGAHFLQLRLQEGAVVELFVAEAPRVVLVDRLGDGEAVEGLSQVDGVALVLHHRVAEHGLGGFAEHLLSQVHHVAIIPVRLVELDHGEFRVVTGGEALVPEIAVDLEHLSKPPTTKRLR